MKLLDKLVLKDLLPMFGVGVLMFFSLWFAADPMLKAGKYLADGIPLPIVLRLMELSIPPVLALTFPMGMLLAVLVGFGRISSDSEAVALFAGGVPFLRIAAPAAVMGVVVSLGGYLINDTLAAGAAKKLSDLQTSVLKQGIHSAQPFDDTIRDKDGGIVWTVHIDGLDLATKQLHNVTITHFADNAPVVLVHAKRAQWLLGERFTLYDVDLYYLNDASHITLPSLASTSDPVEGSLRHTPTELEILQRDPTSLSFHDLRTQIAKLKAAEGASSPLVRDAELGLWSKIAFPFSSLVFTVIGAPLGLQKQRRGSKTTGWWLSILIIFAYYVLYMGMSSVARGGGCPPALAAFLPNIVGLLIGSYLIWKAST